MYTTTAEETLWDATIITGTFSIHSVSAVVLFDFGSTHTFLAQMLVDRFGVLLDELGHDLVVCTPVGATLTTGVCIRGITIVIQCRTLSTEFVVLSMRDFDVFFFMDWMTRH